MTGDTLAGARPAGRRTIQYGAFGKVTKGLDVAQKIESFYPPDTNDGAPTQPVYIVQGDDQRDVTGASNRGSRPLVELGEVAVGEHLHRLAARGRRSRCPRPITFHCPDASRTIAVCSSSPTSTASDG